VDLEAIEMLVRDSMHRAGAAALARLLSMPTPQPNKVSCVCGHTAQYHDKRNKQLLTVLGPVQLQRSYYVRPQCHQGKIPRDEQLGVVGTECSPGVQRMMAAVGSDSSFHHGREQLALLAGLEVTTKAIERHAEAIGTDIARREQDQVNRALQLELPQILGLPVPVMYIELDGTPVPYWANATHLPLNAGRSTRWRWYTGALARTPQADTATRSRPYPAGHRSERLRAAAVESLPYDRWPNRLSEWTWSR
jgi:hypothetical protein